MGAAKKTSGTEPPRDSDLKARMERLKETLPEDPAPPPPKTDVIPYSPGNPTRKAVAAAAREKYKPVPVLRTLSNVVQEKVTWLYPGRIPDCRVSMIMGESGAGKSTFWCYLASRITTGRPWPEGSSPGKPGSVLIIQGEEIVSQEIMEKAVGFGADTEKMHVMDGVTRDGGEMTAVSLAEDVPAIESALDLYGDVRMVIVDPIGDFSSSISGFTEQEARAALRPLRMLAERRKVAIFLIAHMNKNYEAPLIHRVMGSVAFLAISRAFWFLSEDPFDPSRKCLSIVKCNLRGKTTTGLAFGLNEDETEFVFRKEPVRLSGEQVNNALAEIRRRDKVIFKSQGPPTSKVGAAMDFILASLAGGRKLQADVTREAAAAGIKESSFNEALSRLMGKGYDEDDEEDPEVLVFRTPVGRRGKKAKQYWLSLGEPEEVMPSAAEDVAGLDECQLQIWADDGGRLDGLDV